MAYLVTKSELLWRRYCAFFHVLIHIFALDSRIDVLYLDTTYLDPNYSFPPQNDVIQFVTNNIAQSLELNRKTLVVTGTYCIGKEKIFMGMMKAFDSVNYVVCQTKSLLEC